MSEFIDTLIQYSPVENNDNVDLGFEDPLLQADLTNPQTYAELYQVPKPSSNILQDLQNISKDIKSKFPKEKKKQSVEQEDISLPELLKEEGIDFQVTSDYRPGATTKSGHKSNHSIKGGAYDIKPTNGKSFEDLRQEIYSNSRIRNWMNRHNWGIIEETTPEVMSKTGATGKHWHFGPDTMAVQNWRRNLIKYGQNGFKFEDTLQQTNTQIPNLNVDRIVLFKNILTNMDNDIDDYNPYISNTKEEIENQFPVILTPKESKDIWSKIPYSNYSSSKQYSGQIPSLIHNMVSDKTKADILTRIAYNESGFNPNVKNPKSSASGLFGFVNSIKNKFGYGNTPEEQIQGASRLYDSMEQQAATYINKFGNRGLNKAQIMYGMWFSPREMINYLKTGQFSGYRDAQGTNLQKIISKMS